MPGGRPKITLDDLPKNWKSELISMAEQGKSDVQMQAFLGGICHETWQRLIDEEPEFSETIKKCRVLCQSWWENAAQENLMLQKGENFNSTTWIFNMKNRFGWKDKKEVDQKVQGAVIIRGDDADL